MDRMDRQADIEALEKLAMRMDALVRIPGTNLRLGLDTILGIVPGIGDTAALLPAGYIIGKAHQHGAPRSLLVRMAGNVGIDWAIGTIPLIGDIFDFGWKANLRNVALLKAHLAKIDATEKRAALSEQNDPTRLPDLP
ncbi:membrane protein [Litoreibacter roseus]|uniref:Membrane protein n=2 Tax=Litoreibacter roseus TaxID=2601869 RepID=A0A6N6JFS3_9RHOB|nr:membrane protein [Litoreibacter roseus]